MKAQRKDKTEFPVEVSLSPFEIDGERLVIAFIVDITTRKHAEQQLLLHKQMLEDLTKELKAHNEKLEAKVIDRTKILQEALIEIEKSRKEMSEALAKEKELNELKSRFCHIGHHMSFAPLLLLYFHPLLSSPLIPKKNSRKKESSMWSEYNLQ
ncbi:MAG: PAS domain S-box protein [Bacteroidia bacterium]